MKRILLPFALVAIAMPALNARIVVTRQASEPVTKVSLLDNPDLTPTRARAKAKADAQPGFEVVKLVNTGVKISDVQSGKVSLDELHSLTFNRQKAAPHSGSNLGITANAAIISEGMDNFTAGSQSSPVAVTQGLSNVPSKYLSAGVDNLYGCGVYSIGNGMAALMGNANEFRIGDAQAAKPMKIGMWVAALSSGSGVMVNMIEGLNGTAFLLNTQPTAIPYDGNFYWLEMQHNGFTDKNKQPISAEIAIMIMGTNGSYDTDLAFAGLYVDGERYSGKSGGGNTGGGGTGGGTTGGGNTGNVELGIPEDVSHIVAQDNMSFTVNYTAADKATHHQLYTFNDVYGPATAKYLDVDWSPLKIGKNDPQSPSLDYYAKDVALSEIPGGMCHWPVLIDGALGFGYLAQVCESTNSWAGFETSDYDLTATQGEASITFKMYPTDYTVFIINEYCYNKNTGKYDLIDYAELDGGEIQWNQWDNFNVTLDRITGSAYDLNHVYFMFGLISEGPADTPCFLYFQDMQISVDVPDGEMVYYLHGDREISGSAPITQKGDVKNNKFNYIIRGTHHSSQGNFYGDWATDPVDGTFYVKAGDSVESLKVNPTDAPAEYFDLQGRRIANPTAGMYIVRQGNDVKKVLVK